MLCTAFTMPVVHRRISKLVSYRFYDAINANRRIRYCVNKHISWMHIFQMQSVANIIDTFAVTVITKTFFSHHMIYFLLGSQSFACHIRLRTNSAKQPLCVACESYDIHRRLSKQRVMQSNGF